MISPTELAQEQVKTEKRWKSMTFSEDSVFFMYNIILDSSLDESGISVFVHVPT